MEVYFYCSYEHSQTGFFMTRLEDHALVQAVDVPEFAEEFFSYDRFQILWHDPCGKEDRKLWKPQPSGMFFGLRNLRGTMADGRRCTANLLFSAQDDEVPGLRRIALSVLGDYPEFQRQLTGWLRVGGASYELNTDAFLSWMERCKNAGHLTRFTDSRSRASQLLLWMQRRDAPRLETDLLRLAVYTSHWKDVQQVMGQGLAWKLKHPCALSPEEFEQLFVENAPLWELSTES